jgi:glutathione S-transferase
MNLKGHHPGFKVWPGAQADIDRITTIWDECLSTYGGPFLFGERTIADAMYAPVATRFRTYDVKLDAACTGYMEHILSLPEMIEWTAGAYAEPDEVEELDAEF